MIDLGEYCHTQEVRLFHTSQPELKQKLPGIWSNFVSYPDTKGTDLIFNLAQDPHTTAAILSPEFIRLRKLVPDLGRTLLEEPTTQPQVIGMTVDAATTVPTSEETDLEDLAKYRENLANAIGLESGEPTELIHTGTIISRFGKVTYAILLYKPETNSRVLGMRMQTIRVGTFTPQRFADSFNADATYFRRLKDFIPNYLWN
jgi:hypothetical protein